MQNRIFALSLYTLTLGFALLAASRLYAYVPRTDDSGIYVVKWQTSPISMQVKLSDVANLADGNSYASSVIAGMQAWNEKLGTVQFAPQRSSPGAYSSGNKINEIAMDSTMDGDAFPSGVIAITLSYTRGNEMSESDIIFNTAYSWRSYRGALQSYPTLDIQRVAIHELGHVLGLKHPDDRGQSVVAIMNSRVSDVDALQSDDINGGQRLYGAPGFVPSNDNLENASSIVLHDGVTQLSGVTIGATREANEPNHAGSTGTHSTWWKWTPADDGVMTIRTLGSDFDTVLAVYTGTDLSNLALVVSNDDEEPPTETPNPGRRRTSLVTFSATKNTTYYFAVDGWGDTEGLSSGYTGTVSLNLNFFIPLPPIFSAHPGEVTVEAGRLATFSTRVDGRPFPSLRWQRLTVGSSVWTDLADSSVYYGSTTEYLRVTSTLAMEGDKFRCIATNASGSATSAIATLHVTPIPLPVVITQPTDTAVAAGESIVLSVEATGAKSYQWYHNGIVLDGKTTPNLLLANLQTGDAGTYRVLITNDGGAVMTKDATVRVLLLPVVTNTTVTRQALSAGETASFTATATGEGPLNLQWYFNGRPISGATTSSFSRVINGVADAGAYWMAATDSRGTRHGSPSFVVYAPTSTQVLQWGGITNEGTALPPSLTSVVVVDVGWDSAIALKRDGSVIQWGNTALVRQMPPTLNDVADVVVGEMGALALRSDGTVVGTGHFADVPIGLRNVAAIQCGAQDAIALKTDGTVVTWPRREVPGKLSAVAAIRAADHRFYAIKQDGHAVAWNPGSSDAVDTENVVTIDGGIYHTIILRSDGRIDAQNGAGSANLAPPSGLTGVAAISCGTYHAVALKADGTIVAWGDNSFGQTSLPELGGVFRIAAGGRSSVVLRDMSADRPPTIIAAPISRTAIEGESVTLSVSASSNGSILQYQWRKNSAAIPGATKSTLILSDLSTSDAADYDVVVTNTAGAVPSAVATLVIKPLPIVTNLAPTRQILADGQTLACRISASGSGSLAYQWYHDGRPINGATTDSYSQTISNARDLGAYWVAVTDGIGTRFGAPFFALPAANDSQVIAWGDPTFGQTDIPRTLDSAISLSAGWNSVLAVQANGSVQNWGYTSFIGEIPSGVTDAVAVSVGRFSSAILKADGTVATTTNASKPPASLKNVVSIACAADFTLALRTDGTVAAWGGAPTIPSGLRNVIAIAAGAYHALALKSDGTVVTWGAETDSVPPVPSSLKDVIALAAGYQHSLALKADGTVVAWGHYGNEIAAPPSGLANVISISAGTGHAVALQSDGKVVAWGESYYGKNLVPTGLGAAFGAYAGGHVSFALVHQRSANVPVLLSPFSSATYLGGTVNLSVSLLNSVSASLQWQRNGIVLHGMENPTLALANLNPAQTGIYSAIATTSSASTTSYPAIVALFISDKVAGDGIEVGPNIVHPNKNVYDQLLLKGAAATIRADPGQVARISFVDLNDDIVQVEMSGSGSLSLVLDGASGPASPVNYHQPDISYMKGHAGIVITGADPSTNLSVFSVGRANAVNQSLFNDGTAYDGVADIAFIAIHSFDGRFGGLRTANVNYWATEGVTGVYAPHIEFKGPVYIGDINAYENATPMLTLGSAETVQINGGDLRQNNGRSVQASGVSRIEFVDGTTSHNKPLPAQMNQAHLENNGADITSQIVVNPNP